MNRTSLVLLWEDLKHASHVAAEGIRRFWCRVYGHDWREDHGELNPSPIIPPLAVCRRCGKFERLLG